MRSISAAAVTTIALTSVLTLGATLPAEAGQVCSRLGLSDNCVKSSDMNANIKLERSGRNGKFRVRNEDGENAFQLNGRRANATSFFSNEENESNGFVKAWAQINADGSIDSCWRCNTDTAETQRTGTGTYEVDFTPLATDIRGRPRSATIDNHGTGNAAASVIDLADRSGDPSSVFVNTADTNGGNSDRPFVLIIY